jgi:3-methyladenine DNA glycosylase/8-oxoguanine DNA glycosylase
LGLDDAVQRLSALPGIGEWTAQYVALRAFGEPDAFPAGDLGLRRALADDAGMPSTPLLSRMAESWQALARAMLPYTSGRAKAR